MSKTDLTAYMLGSNHNYFTQIEKNIIEIKLIVHFYNELLSFFHSKHRNFLKLLKPPQEINMFGTSFMRELLNDILSTEEYSLSGIANYINIPEEVLFDIVTGINTNPTFDLCRKLFELHAAVRPKLYEQFMKRIAMKY